VNNGSAHVSPVSRRKTIAGTAFSGAKDKAD